MLFIFHTAFYTLFVLSQKLARTHTHKQAAAHRSQEGGRKSIREPSPFTFISHLFLIPPPFWSFLFSALSLPQLLFYQLRGCVWSTLPINQRTLSGKSLKDLTTTARFPDLRRYRVCLCVCVWRACTHVRSCQARALALSSLPPFAPANTAGCLTIIKELHSFAWCHSALSTGLHVFICVGVCTRVCVNASSLCV